MFGSYVIIGIIGIILIAYLGLVIPIGATTGFQIQVPLVPMNGIIEPDQSPDENQSTVFIVSSGPSPEPLLGISTGCSVFSLEEPLELEISDDSTAFNILRVFVPSCEVSNVSECLDSDTTLDDAINDGLFVFGNISVGTGISVEAWVIGNTWALDSEGNLYKCASLEIEIPEGAGKNLTNTSNASVIDASGNSTNISDGS